MGRTVPRFGECHLSRGENLKRGLRAVAGCAGLVLGLTGSACEDSEERSEVAVRDSAGIRIVLSSRSEFGRVSARDVFDPPTASLGGAGSTELGQVLGGVLFDDGGFAVADGMERTILSVSPDGRVRWRFGGEGDGPGEFREPVSFSLLPGDSVVLYDRRAGRATVVAPDGSLARIRTFDVGSSGRRPESVWPIGADEWVAWYTDISDSRRLASDGQAVLEEFRHSLWIIRRDSTDQLVYSGFAGGMVKTGSMILFSPYRTSAHAATRAGTIAVGASHQFDVRVFSPQSEDADQLVIRNTDEGMDHLGMEEVARIGDSLDAIARAEGAEESFYRPVFREALLPDRRPLFSDILIAADGAVWINRFAPFGRPSRDWMAFAADGRFLGELALEPGTRLLDVGAVSALLARSDAYGVEHVEYVPANWPWLNRANR